MNTLYPKQIAAIRKIIDRSRHHEENFLLDSQSAAVRVMQYLHDEGMLQGKVVTLEKINDVSLVNSL